MAETLHIPAEASKKEIYTALLPQIEALIGAETDQVANMANLVAALRYGLGFFWVGFYIVRNDELVLGPFQGPIACTRISKGRGVCGTSWAEARTILVPDVEAFPGHIACSSDSKSEIVIPMIKNSQVLGVLDVDSDRLNDFDAVDKQFLEEIVAKLVRRM